MLMGYCAGEIRLATRNGVGGGVFGVLHRPTFARPFVSCWLATTCEYCTNCALAFLRPKFVNPEIGAGFARGGASCEARGARSERGEWVGGVGNWERGMGNERGWPWTLLPDT